jgi:hypothetical protein
MYSPSASADYVNALGVQAEALEVCVKQTQKPSMEEMTSIRGKR